MDEPKLCESAYLTASPSLPGSFRHAAAVIDRGGQSAHLYMVRGEGTDSVVSELHKQLIQAGRLPRSTNRRGTALPSLVFFACAALVLGLTLSLVGGAGSR